MTSILVTGGAKRLGRAIAEGLAKAGHPVIVHYHGSADEAETVATGIRKAGGRADIVGCDLTDRTEVAGLIAACTQKGPLAGLVNNAALFEPDDPAALDVAAFDRQMQVNLLAPMILAQELFRHAEAGGNQAAIVNILDNKLFALNPDHASYTTAKAGLAAATEMMAMRFAPLVRVNGVAPGITLPAPGQSDTAFAKAQKMNLLSRGVSTNDILRTVLFLFDSPTVTGQIIAVDSGQRMMHLPRDVSYLTEE